MEKTKGVSKTKKNSLRFYKEKTLYLLTFILCISLWVTMVNNTKWTFNDILYELVCLVVIVICSMYSNLSNGFSIFHLRIFRMTRERLTSLLIGLAFPISYIIFKAVQDSVIESFIRSISFHNFLSLFMYFIPFVLFVAVLIYYSYVILEPKRSKKRQYEQYSEEIESSIARYNSMSLNMILIISLFSIWFKLAFNLSWSFDNISTEIIVFLIFVFMKVLGNTRNGLDWYHAEKFKFNKYFILTFLVPYIVMLFLFIVNKSFRIKLEFLGIKYVVSYLMYLLPLFIICSAVISYIVSELSNVDFGFSKSDIKQDKKVLSREKALRKENILFAITLTIIFIQLSWIYILTSIVTYLTVELLLQMFMLFIPLAIIFYIVFYYSLKEINR